MKQPRNKKNNILTTIIGIAIMVFIIAGCPTPFDNVQGQIDDLKVELTELRDEITRIDGEIARIDTTIDNYVELFTDEVDKLDKLIADNTQAINENYDDLQQQIADALDTALTKLGEFEDDINNRVDNLETDVYAEIAQLTSSINTLVSIADNHNVRISALEDNVTWITETAIPNAISGLRDELLPQIQDNTLGISANTAAITTLTSRADSLETAVANLENSLSTLEGRVDDLGIDDIDGLSISLSELGDDISELRSDMVKSINDLRDELIEYINNEIKDVNDDITALAGRVADNESDIIGILADIVDLQTTLSALQTTVSELDIDDIAGLHAALEGLQSEIDNLETQLTAYINAEIAGVNATIATLTGRVADNESAIAGILSDITSLQNTLFTLQTTVSELDIDDITGLRAALDSLGDEIEALETQLTDFIDDDIATILARIEALESAVGIGEDELNDLLEDYENLADAIEYILGVLEGNGNGGPPGGGGGLPGQIAALQEQIDDLEERIDALEASIGTPTVNYDANGGTMGTVPIDDTEYELWDEVVVLDNTGNLAGPVIRDGIMQRFIGWNTNPTATDVLLNPGETFDITGSTTLYAIYTTGDDVLRKVGPAGGWVFYDFGSTESWGRYLEAWNEDEPGTYKLKTSRTYTPGTTMNIGGGYENTYVGMSDISIHPAAEAVVNATHGGFNDWFLPSRHELNELYRVLHYTGYYGSEVQESVADFSDEFYWSSSFGGPDTGFSWAINFKYTESLDPDNHFYHNDNDGLRVRAVRAF